MQKLPQLHRSLFLFLLFTLMTCCLVAQDQATVDLSKLLTAMLGPTPIEEDLQELCDRYGGRVTGTQANTNAVDWALAKFKAAGLSAQKEAFTMPALWVENYTSLLINGDAAFKAKAVALSYTHTGEKGISAQIIDTGKGTEEDFEHIGERAKGNILLIETAVSYDISTMFTEYMNAIGIEDRAYKAGAAGLIYMSSRPKKLLYRVLPMKAVSNSMPMCIMAREDAKRCLRIMRNAGNLKATLKIDAQIGGEYTSHNVIAEIKGITLPEEVIIIGAHIDSWGLGTGALDNGCNISMMIDIARQMKKLGIQPKRTIRFALWNGEEQGMFGSLGYTKSHAAELDNHQMALSVDIGSGPIIGFFTNGRPEVFALTEKVLEPVSGLGPFLNIDAPIVGTDNYDFMLEGVANLVANHKPATYAQNYHAESDTYDKVDLQALKINSAVVAALALGFANADITYKRQSREAIEKLIETTTLKDGMHLFNLWAAWEDGSRGRTKVKQN